MNQAKKLKTTVPWHNQSPLCKSGLNTAGARKLVALSTLKPSHGPCMAMCKASPTLWVFGSAPWKINAQAKFKWAHDFELVLNACMVLLVSSCIAHAKKPPGLPKDENCCDSCVAPLQYVKVSTEHWPMIAD